jgi:hypothetical protein
MIFSRLIRIAIQLHHPEAIIVVRCDDVPPSCLVLPFRVHRLF